MHNELLRKIGSHLDKLEHGSGRAVYESTEAKLRKILKDLTEWEKYSKK